MCGRKRKQFSWLAMGQFYILHQLRGQMSELSDKLDGINTQLSKARGEIVGKIGELEEALRNAQIEDPAVTAALDNLSSSAQQLDDVVADVADEADAAE